MLNFDEAPEFQKDVKILKKSWRSIPDDIEKAKLVIARLYMPIKGVDMDEFRNGFFASSRATVLHTRDGREVVKMRLDCKSLGNDKKNRLVFVAIQDGSVVTLVELYAKNDKDNHDESRIRKYLV